MFRVRVKRRASSCVSIRELEFDRLKTTLGLWVEAGLGLVLVLVLG